MRLFVGIAIPEDICERLAGLRSGLAGTRWVDVEAMHLTLRFIGTVDEPSAADLDDELSRIEAPAFKLSFSGIGSFASGTRLRQLWVGTEKSAPLHPLRKRARPTRGPHRPGMASGGTSSWAEATGPSPPGSCDRKARPTPRWYWSSTRSSG